MKIKQVESILKQEKTIIVTEGEDCQWLSNGAAYYPVYNFPELTKNNIFAIFDIPEDKQEQFYFEQIRLPVEKYNFDHTDKSEKLLNRSDVALVARKQVLEPLETSQGLMFINRRLLKPFDGGENGYSLYERTGSDGRIYIAIKDGFLLLGIVLPVCINNDELINILTNWISQQKITLANYALKKEERYAQMNMKEMESKEEQDV